VFYVQLADYHGLTRETCPFKFREETESMFQRLTAQRLKKRAKSEKESHPHILCMSGPGTGKSHLVDRGLESLKSIPADAVNEYADLRRLANESSVAVHISFNSGTSFNRWDVKIGAEAAAASRVLTSYFGINKNLPDLKKIPGIENLSMRTAVEVVLSHYRGSRSHMRAQARANLGAAVDGTDDDIDDDVLFYLGIDDVSSIVPLGEKVSAASNWSVAKGKTFLKEIFNGLFEMYSGEEYFLACIVSGTIYGPVSDILTDTAQKFANLPVPLLPLDETVDLAIRAMKQEVAQGRSHYAYRNDDICMPFKLLLADIGGIPRYVWEAIEFVMLHDPTLVDDIAWEKIRESLTSNMKSRYKLEENVLKEALYLALLRQVYSPDRPVSGGETLRDLENRGKLFISTLPHKPGEYVVQIPLMHLECYLSGNKQLQSMIKKLRDLRNWMNWEDLCIHYEALLLHSVRYFCASSGATITVGEFYTGAIVGSEVADFCLSIPDASDNRPIKVVQLQAWYPETARALPGPVDSRFHKVYKNARGAKIDAFIFHKGVEKDTSLLRCLHFKHTEAGKTDLTLSDIDGDKKGADEALKEASATRPELQGCSAIHVQISNRALRIPDGTHLPEDVVVITKDELPAYFGFTFADRMELMMRMSNAASEGRDPYWDK
jgi:hypothetical protein